MPAEEAGIAPVIHVTVARGRIRVRDNGPGIPPETVASILDFTTRTSSREAYVSPDRGRQGNAAKTVVAMPFALSGEEGRVEIVARGVRHEITFAGRPDRPAAGDRPPAASAAGRFGKNRHHRDGALARVIMVRPGGRGAALLTDGRAVRSPQPAPDDLRDLGRRGSFDRRERLTRRATAPDWTKWTPAAPTCPHWYRRAELERLIGAFLTHDRQHKSVRLLRDFLAEFNGLSGTAKRKAVLEAVGLQRAPLERLLLDGGAEFDHDLVDRLLAAMQDAARPIKPDALGAARQGERGAQLRTLPAPTSRPSATRCSRA